MVSKEEKEATLNRIVEILKKDGTIVLWIAGNSWAFVDHETIFKSMVIAEFSEDSYVNYDNLEFVKAHDNGNEYSYLILDSALIPKKLMVALQDATQKTILIRNRPNGVDKDVRGMLRRLRRKGNVLVYVASKEEAYDAREEFRKSMNSATIVKFNDENYDFNAIDFIWTYEYPYYYELKVNSLVSPEELKEVFRHARKTIYWAEYKAKKGKKRRGEV